MLRSSSELVHTMKMSSMYRWKISGLIEDEFTYNIGHIDICNSWGEGRSHGSTFNLLEYHVGKREIVIIHIHVKKPYNEVRIKWQQV